MHKQKARALAHEPCEWVRTLAPVVRCVGRAACHPDPRIDRAMTQERGACERNANEQDEPPQQIAKQAVEAVGAQIDENEAEDQPEGGVDYTDIGHHRFSPPCWYEERHPRRSVAQYGTQKSRCRAAA